VEKDEPTEKIGLTELEQLVEDEKVVDRATGILPPEESKEASGEEAPETETPPVEAAAEDTPAAETPEIPTGEDAPPEPEQNLDYWKERATQAEGELKGAKDFATLAASLPAGTDPPDIDKIIDGIEISDETDARELLKQALTATQTLQQSSSEREATVRDLQASHAQAREKHNGQDGWESYDDLYGEVVYPLFKDQPKAMRLMAELPNSGEATYVLGMLMKYDWPTMEAKIKDKFRAELRTEIIDDIDKTSKASSPQPSGGRAQVEQSAKNDLMDMNDDEFEAEIAKAKMQQPQVAA